MKRIVIALTVLLLIGAGCSSGSEQESLSVTEQKRRSVDPKVGQFLLEAQRAYERGAYGMALALSDSAEAYAPDLADLHFLRGVVYTQLNQLHVAQAAYETVLELDPAYPGARFNMGLNAFRRGQLRDAIDFEPGFAPEARQARLQVHHRLAAVSDRAGRGGRRLSRTRGRRGPVASWGAV